MSINNYIRDLLNIKNKNIVINLNNIIVKKVKYVDTKFIYGKLSYTPDCCACCGSVNENYSIIKNGTKKSNIKMPNVCNFPTVLVLSKQRFLCKSCGSTFSAETDFVDKFSFISNNFKRKVAINLMNVSSFDSYYDRFKSAINTAIKYLDDIKNTLNTSYSNGRLEGINNKFKVIKIVSYGYRSFDNFRLIIFLCFYHKKIYGLRLIA